MIDKTHEISEKNTALGCFGSPTCHASDSLVCKACAVYDECGTESLKTIERIREIVNVDGLLRDHKQARLKNLAESDSIDKPAVKKPIESPALVVVEAKVTYDIDEERQKLIVTLPVKAQSFALTLCKSGLLDRIKESMPLGLNPLEKCGPKWLSIALSMLMNGGFKRSELKAQLMAKLEWTESSAASHTSLAVKLFETFEIAKENSGNEFHPIINKVEV